MRHRIKVLAVIATVTVLIGCSPPPEPLVDAYQRWSMDVAGGGCASGLRLKTTGFCTDDNPALLGAATNRQPASDTCKWRLAEVPVAAEKTIMFRAITCLEPMAWDVDHYVPLERPDKDRFFTKSRSRDAAMAGVHQITEHLDWGVASIEQSVVTIVELSPGETAQDFALGWRQPDLHSGKPLPTCIVVPRNDTELGGEGFVLAATDGSQGCDEGLIWEARPGLALLHYGHGLGSSLDHLSYTLYVRQADGRWVRRT